MNTNTGKLTLWQMFNLNFGILGVQFVLGQFIVLTGFVIAVEVRKVGFHWYWWVIQVISLILPVFAMAVQPLVGFVSDHTSSSYGKRLPYIFWGTIAAAIFLLLLVHSLSSVFMFPLLWLFAAAINVALQPFRSMAADVVSDNQQRTTIYAMQAGLIGVGYVLAALLPWPFAKSYGHHLGEVVKHSCYLGVSVLLISVIWTVIMSRKYITKIIAGENSSTLREKIITVSGFPKLMLQISCVQFFSWLGLSAFMGYLLFSIRQTSHSLKATSFGLICTLIYLVVSVIFSGFIPWLSYNFSRKIVHCCALITGGIAIILLYLISGRTYLLMAMVGVGITFASINSIPFAMVASVAPSDKRGLYMGLFNITAYLPLVIFSLLASYLLTNYFHNQAIYMMVLAGEFLLVAAGLTLFVRDKSEE